MRMTKEKIVSITYTKFVLFMTILVQYQKMIE